MIKRSPHISLILAKILENIQGNPPIPDFDPKANARFDAVTQSMEDDNFYANHTRPECAAEWRRRYAERKEQGL